MFLIKGQVLGVKQQVRVNRETGEEVTSYLVGIQSPKESGYDGEVVVQDIRVTKKQMGQGLQASYENIKGQEVIAPVFAMPWASKKGNAGLSWFFDGDGKPLKVDKPK